jgi:hypothetical protein
VRQKTQVKAYSILSPIALNHSARSTPLEWPETWLHPREVRRSVQEMVRAAYQRTLQKVRVRAFARLF